MSKFAANLTMMFNEVPFLERFAKAASAGFDTVEFLFPFVWPADTLAALLEQHHLQMSLFNLPAGNWDAGERGMAALPGREEEFRQSVALGMEYARALRCPKVHIMAGVTAGLDRARCEALFIDNLRYAADRFAELGVTVVLEPLNDRDMPGYFVAHQRQMVELIERIDRPNVKLQFDIYHAQIMDGDLTVLLRDLAPFVGHVQVAAVPDRHEPDHGELHFPWIFKVIDDIGYSGYIGCEYRPAGTTEAGLGWLAQYR